MGRGRDQPENETDSLELVCLAGITLPTRLCSLLPLAAPFPAAPKKIRAPGVLSPPVQGWREMGGGGRQRMEGGALFRRSYFILFFLLFMLQKVAEPARRRGWVPPLSPSHCSFPLALRTLGLSGLAVVETERS